MRRRTPPTVFLALLLGACAGEGPESGPGTLTLAVTSPNGAEGAAVVVLIGEGFGQVTPVGGVETHSFTGAGSTQVVLIHPTGGDLTFTVEVPDTTVTPAFAIQQVAGPDDQLRGSLADYGLERVR